MHQLHQNMAEIRVESSTEEATDKFDRKASRRGGPIAGQLDTRSDSRGRAEFSLGLDILFIEQKRGNRRSNQLQSTFQ